jgi:hypothetical protein
MNTTDEGTAYEQLVKAAQEACEGLPAARLFDILRWAKAEERVARSKQGAAEHDLDKDLTGAPCPCGGTFQETSIYDGWEGTLHCTKCADKIDRYQTIERQSDVETEPGSNPGEL